MIIELAEPMLDAAETEREHRAALRLATVAWNASLLPREARRALSAACADLEDAEELERVVDFLIRRRKSLFPDAKRLVLDHKLIRIADTWRLDVVSRPI